MRALYDPGMELGDSHTGADVDLGEARARLRSLRPPRLEVAHYLAFVELATERELAPDREHATAIRELTESGIVEAVPADEPCVRLTTLYRAAARAEAATCDRQVVHERRQQVIAAREALRVLDYGIAAAADDGDWAGVCRIFDRWWPELLLGPEAATAQRALNAAPAQVRARYPGAVFGAELIGLTPIRPFSVESLWRRTGGAEGADGGEGTDVDELRLTLRRLCLAIAARRRRGQVLEAMQVADEVLCWAGEVAERLNGAPSLSAFWLLQAGLTYESGWRWDKARLCYRLAWRVRETDALGFSARGVAAKLAVLAAIGQDTAETRLWAERGRAAVARWSPLTRDTEAGLQLAELVMAVDRLDLGQAAALHEGLERPSEELELFHHLLWAHTHHLLTIGRAAEAWKLVDDTTSVQRRLIRGDGIHASVMTTIRVNVLLALGRRAAAERTLRGLELDTPEIVLAGARARALLGDWTGALTLLASVPQEAPRRVLLPVGVLQAVCYLRLGRPVEAAQRFGDVLRALDGEVRVLCTVPSSDVEELVGLVPEADALVTAWRQAGLPCVYPFPSRVVELTDRETAVLRQLARGLTLKEIAGAEVVSINTIKTQVRSLYGKFGVDNRADLVIEAGRLGQLAASKCV